MTTVNKKSIMSGKEVFRMMDGMGLPLEIIIIELRERDMGFNVPEFIMAAKASKNFSRDRLRRLLDDPSICRDEEGRKLALDTIDQVYEVSK